MILENVKKNKENKNKMNYNNYEYKIIIMNIIFNNFCNKFEKKKKNIEILNN